jgi:PAT family beta-lactamase induction signal transducer AmpG
MAAMLALGFSSGAPFMVTADILKAWLTDAKVDLATIGLFSAVSFPYTFKFVWSPIMDRFRISLFGFGRRRGWMILTQLLIAATVAALGQFDPVSHLGIITAIAVLISFFSASQDIVLDAYRREFLTDTELGLGTGLWINAYRLANLAIVGFAFVLADSWGYSAVFACLGLFMSVGIVATILLPEPALSGTPPRTLREAVVEPLREFFLRRGAWWILAFVLLYKVGDNMASAMNIPFILSLGFQKPEYFLIVKGAGMAGLFGGMFLGGLIMTRLKVARSLWIFGALQMVSTAGFGLLAISEKSTALLTAVVVFELFTSGLGQTAYSTLIAIQTDRRFTATQFALMTSLMAVPGKLVAAVTGFLAQDLGWAPFYLVCTFSALPGMALLLKIAPWRSNRVLHQEDA